MSEDMLKDSWKPKGPVSKKIKDRLQKKVFSSLADFNSNYSVEKNFHIS